VKALEVLIPQLRCGTEAAAVCICSYTSVWGFAIALFTELPISLPISLSLALPHHRRQHTPRIITTYIGVDLTSTAATFTPVCQHLLRKSLQPPPPLRPLVLVMTLA
jgi:hypothetical protein